MNGATFTGASLRRAKFERANLCGADLTRADLRKADFLEANLEKGILREADLRQAQLVDTKLNAADLTGAHVYGVSVWNVELAGTSQDRLIVSRENEPLIIVDQLEVAQFIYLLLDNQKLRNLLDTITSKVVLILGRFTEHRRAVLDALRHELRRRGLAPIVFDFDKPTSKDVTGTVEILARMARIVIADLTDPSSIPHELATVVPYLRTTPVVLLRLKGAGGYSMVGDLVAYDRWVLPVHEYVSGKSLIAQLGEVLAPAEERLKQLRPDVLAEKPLPL
jgi:Pentapeptide repeats (8 copies)